MRAAALAVACLLLATPGGAPAAEGPTRTLADGQVLRGRFLQTRHLEGFQAPLRSAGRFVIAPGTGMIWHTETPFSILTVISPAGLLQESGGVETTRLPAARLPFLGRLYEMLEGALAGDWRALEARFAVSRRGDDQAWTVDLTPRPAPDPAAMPIRAIAVTGARFVDEVRIVRQNGDEDRIVFLDQAVATGSLTDDERSLLGTVSR